MDKPNDDQTQAWVQRWARVGPLLQAISEAEESQATMAEVLPQFDDALRSALLLSPAEPWSGLVEQQKYFRRGRR